MRCGRGILVFGALGLVWAAQLASFLRVGCFAHDDGLALVALPLIVPVGMSVLGCLLAWLGTAKSERRGRIERGLVVAVLVPATGMIIGVLAGLFWWPEQVATAAAHGLAFGAVALVLLVPVIVMLHSSSRSRSLMDASDRLVTWSYAGSIACVSSVLTVPQWKAYPMCDSDPVQSIAMTAAGAASCAVAALMLVLHARHARRVLAAPTCSVDIGLRDEPPDAPQSVYRHAALPPVVLHAPKAQSTMDRRALVALVCAAVSLGLAVIGIGCRLADLVGARLSN